MDKGVFFCVWASYFYLNCLVKAAIQSQTLGSIPPSCSGRFLLWSHCLCCSVFLEYGHLFWTGKSTLIFWRQISWCNQFGHFHEQKDLKDNRKCQSWSPLPLTFTFFTRSFGPHRRTLSNLSFYSLTSCGARSEVLSYNNAAIHRRVVRHPSTSVPWVMSCVRLYLEEVQASMLPRSAGMILNPLTGVIIV